MKHTSRIVGIVVLLALVVCCALLATSCGKKADPAEPETNGITTPEVTQAATPEATTEKTPEPTKPTVYTVTFNANGGEGTMAAVESAAGNVTLPANAFTREEYTFKGWATTADGEKAYDDGATYALSANATLYAVWEQVTYTVTFNANGGTGTMEALTGTKGQSVKLPANAFTPTGHKYFVGWSLTSDGTATIENEANYTISGDATLYAVWDFTVYTVTFDANGGSGTMAPITGTYGKTSKLPANAFTIEAGKYFAGWSMTKNGAVNYSDEQNYAIMKDATLYAVWKPSTLTVNFVTEASGSGGTMEPLVISYGAPQVLPACTFTPPSEHNEFRFWRVTMADGSKIDATPTTTFSAPEHGAEIVVATAMWKAKDYTVTFHSNYGTDATETMTKPYSSSDYLPGDLFARSNCTFKGWATKADATTADYAAGAVYTISGDADLYAVWEKGKMTVVYHGNGGSYNSAASYTRTVEWNDEETVKLTDNLFTRKNFTFVGFATSATPSASDMLPLSDGKFVVPFTNGTVDVYAIWQSTVSYNLTFTSNGGTGSMDAVLNVKPGSGLTLPANTFTRTNYVFVGWATAPDGEVVYADKAGILIPEPATEDDRDNGVIQLYAVWKFNGMVVQNTGMLTGRGAFATGYLDAPGQTVTTGMNATLLKADGTVVKDSIVTGIDVKKTVVASVVTTDGEFTVLLRGVDTDEIATVAYIVFSAAD